MKILTVENAEIHAPLHLISVRKNEDGLCSIWVAGTAMGTITKEEFDRVKEWIDDDTQCSG